MPRDLFGAVASPPPSVRSRRSSVVSILVHAAVIAAVLLFSLLGGDRLPMPQHEALAYFEVAMPAGDVTLQAPPSRVRTGPPVDPAFPAVDPNAAPVVAPEGITAETGIEATISTRPGTLEGLEDSAGTLIGSVSLEEPPRPPPPAEPVRMHSGIRTPMNVTHVAPIYPALAQRARVEGTVILEATIDAQGRVVSVNVLRSIPLLDQAALDAVSQWRYTAALLNGVPVPVIMTVTMRFTLQ